jgi:hypothetical protein
MPVSWHLVADEATARSWQPLLAKWSEDGVSVHPVLARKGMASYSATRAARCEPTADLLPPDFAARYHQQYVDRLWMRGLGAVVAIYVVGVAIYLVALQVLGYQDGRLKTQLAGIANTYTNVLRLKERVEVLQEQLDLKYAALDCFKVASENLPEDFSLVSLSFGKGRTLQLSGTAPPGHEGKVMDYNQAMRSVTKDGEKLFRDVTPAAFPSRVGSDLVNWHFECELNISDAAE